jgi:hypothetical protein
VLFRGNYRMVRVSSRERERRIDICAFEIRIVEKDCLSRLAVRQQAENVGNSNAQATNARAAMHNGICQPLRSLTRCLKT